MYLETKYFNNGYGCSCCRNDWDEVKWVETIPTLEELVNKLDDFVANIYDGGQVGVKYEYDGKALYSVEADITRGGGQLTLYIGEPDSEEYLYKDKYSKSGLTKEEILNKIR